MSDLDTRRRLAALIVGGLELGTRKREWDVLDDLFGAFDVDLGVLDTPHPAVDDARRVAAEALAQAAPSAPALLNELVRCGGRFVAMVDEVYEWLSQYAITTRGTTETFRLRRDDVDAELTLSPAFVEEIRRQERRLFSVLVGEIDTEALSRFINADNGELYGRWPLGDEEGLHLADAVLHLAWLVPAGADAVAPVGERARTSAERLVSAAEGLVRAYLNGLDRQAQDGEQYDEDEVDPDDFAAVARRDNARAGVESERRRYERSGMIGTAVFSDYVTNVEQQSVLGLDRNMRPVLVPIDDLESGTGASHLAGFVAMWRTGRWAGRRQDRLRERLGDPSSRDSWLTQAADACDQAATWLENEIFTPLGTIEAEHFVDVVEEYLALPLWRQRALLYEVWILVAALRAVTSAGWEAQLLRLAQDRNVWRLDVGPSAEPVAALRRASVGATLEIWREPRRVVPSGVVTPDLTIATTGLVARDLVVVEAKDRYEMPADLSGSSRGRRARATETALWTARRYATALRPAVTWVCNHCDIRGASATHANLGDPWTRIHLGTTFRPGNVPTAFAESLQQALEPPPDSPDADTRPSQVTFVVDVTGSMRNVLPGAWDLLRSAQDALDGCVLRAVLFSDHGANEPFLVRKIGPFEGTGSLVDALASQPEGGGGDHAEALEDAMLRCRELMDDIGAQTVVVLTDAPPHPPTECPYRVDFAAEVGALLAGGCRVLVATDWQQDDDDTWQAFGTTTGFAAAPLPALLTQFSTEPAPPGSRSVGSGEGW